MPGPQSKAYIQYPVVSDSSKSGSNKKNLSDAKFKLKKIVQYNVELRILQKSAHYFRLISALIANNLLGMFYKFLNNFLNAKNSKWGEFGIFLSIVSTLFMLPVFLFIFKKIFPYGPIRIDELSILDAKMAINDDESLTKAIAVLEPINRTLARINERSIYAAVILAIFLFCILLNTLADPKQREPYATLSSVFMLLSLLFVTLHGIGEKSVYTREMLQESAEEYKKILNKILKPFPFFQLKLKIDDHYGYIEIDAIDTKIKLSNKAIFIKEFLKHLEYVLKKINVVLHYDSKNSQSPCIILAEAPAVKESPEKLSQLLIDRLEKASTLKVKMRSKMRELTKIADHLKLPNFLREKINIDDLPEMRFCIDVDNQDNRKLLIQVLGDLYGGQYVVEKSSEVILDGCNLVGKGKIDAMLANREITTSIHKQNIQVSGNAQPKQDITGSYSVATNSFQLAKPEKINKNSNIPSDNKPAVPANFTNPKAVVWDNCEINHLQKHHPKYFKHLEGYSGNTFIFFNQTKLGKKLDATSLDSFFRVFENANYLGKNHHPGQQGIVEEGSYLVLKKLGAYGEKRPCGNTIIARGPDGEKLVDLKECATHSKMKRSIG